MAADPLQNLSGPGKPLKAEPPDAAETAGLLRTGRARLQDAANPALSLESRFDLAYNAAHALCTAALQLATSGRTALHRLQCCLRAWAWAPVWRVLDKCHNTRNLGEYRLLDIDEAPGGRLVKRRGRPDSQPLRPAAEADETAWGGLRMAIARASACGC